jgi:hypothetical protein
MSVRCQEETLLRPLVTPEMCQLGRVACPGITDEIYDCPCSLFVERPTPCARTYANQSVEDSREVALIAEAARQGHIR